jgi:hypothetical protein
MAGEFMTKEKTTTTIRFDRPVEMRALTCGRFWCMACSRLATMVTVEQASVLAELPGDALLDRIDSLHFRRRPSGDLMICLDSLARTSTILQKEPDYEL